MCNINESSYVEQINRVQDYIESHLDERITIKQLSEIVNFSEFHFQRIFSIVTKESLYSFVKRIRLEKAKYLLLADKKKPIIDIALSVGFSSHSSFSKAFKQKYGINASRFRRNNSIEGYKTINKVTESVFKDNNIEINPLKVEIRYEKSIKLIYIRYTGPYKGDDKLFERLFNKLYVWAKCCNLVSHKSRWFVIYHDLGNETCEEQLRISVCMSVDKYVDTSGDIGFFTLKEGKYGVGSFFINSNEYIHAWRYMYTKWIPNSKYKLDDRFSFEYYPCTEEQGDKRLVDIYIPILM